MEQRFRQISQRKYPFLHPNYIATESSSNVLPSFKVDDDDEAEMKIDRLAAKWKPTNNSWEPWKLHLLQWSGFFKKNTKDVRP